MHRMHAKSRETEVQHVIRANILPYNKTIAYIYQRMLNRAQSNSNGRLADFCNLMPAL